MGRIRSVVLASASPRRRWLLEAACIDVDVRPADVDESWEGLDPTAGAISVACRKLEDVVGRSAGPEEILLAADTMVVLDGAVLGKPKSDDDAFQMLTALGNRTHQVVTGFSVAKGHERASGAMTTEVTFRPLSAEEIKRYIDSREPFDKAGGYGIQGAGGALVRRINGSYTNVVGLPLTEVIEAMERLDDRAAAS